MINNHEITNVGLSGITVLPGRHRRLNDEIVKQLSASIKEIGLINPITLTPVGGNAGYNLIAGCHRLEAAKRLKLDSVPAIIFDGLTALEVEEIELRENLDRGDLSAAEQSIHFARLKEIAEQKNRLRSGGKQGNQNAKKGEKKGETRNDGSQVEKNRSRDSGSNTAKVVAKETGRAASTVERDAHRVKAIPEIEKVVGTSLDKGVELDALAKMPKEKQAEIIDKAVAGEKVSAKTELKKQERAEKEKTLAARQTALPDKNYGVVYADPEWSFSTYSSNGMDRSADNHYPTSSTDEICQRDVGSISAPDCVLFLWATVPMLPDALRVMDAWGFDYKSSAVWAKDKVGTGYWFRNQHELLLVGTRGNVPAPAMGDQWSSLITAPVGKHSEKPSVVYELIESYFPTLSKIELNARSTRDGWDAWGYEAGKGEAA